MSLDAVISADLVKTRAEIAALSSAVSSARSEIAGVNIQITSTSVIKSVQRGVISFLASGPNEVIVNIAAVNPSKSVLSLLGVISYIQSGDGSTAVPNPVMLQLLNENQLKANSLFGIPWYSAPKASWELVEYK